MTRTIITAKKLTNGLLIGRIPSTLRPLPAVGETVLIDRETEEDGHVTYETLPGQVIAVDEQAQTYDLLVGGDQA